MPDQNIPPQNSFEAPNLPEHHEEEIKSIGQEAEAKGLEYKEQGIEKERREVFKEVTTEKHSEPTSQQAAMKEDDSISEAERIKIANKTEKLNKVMEYASKHGPIKASLLAKRIGDPWLEDKFHDELIKIHDDLVQRGQLKQE